jgi:hypothetical protein
MSAYGNLTPSSFRYENQLWNVSILPAELAPLEPRERVATSDDKATQKCRREAKVES